jgi:catechol 2,3-dioxygenase-like lactoylglutathione lyase family enzyme
MAIDVSAGAKFDVGGILLDQPFKIRRLGHFGFNVYKLDECLHFYRDLLGFRISDVAEFGRRALPPEVFEALGSPTTGYFMRYGGDHHAFVLFNRAVMDARGHDRRFGEDITINQITWQVGSLREVGDAADFFLDRQVEIQRTGRDMPGSNWHTYIYDPDGHTNELYYGMEQVGWDGLSKPKPMYSRGFREKPPLPQIAEFEEVQQALADGVDPLSGYRDADGLEATYDVDGVLLPRPFKIVRIGPVRLFVGDVDRSTEFYQRVLGFTLTEEIEFQRQRCTFLRSNTEHHSLALYPRQLRSSLGLSDHSSCVSFGVQVANYRQLRDAVQFLGERGVRIVELPAELSLGIDYSAFAIDPDGHAIELFYGMDQIGWDGQPRPRPVRREGSIADWPKALAARSDTYMGEPFLGPWG